MASIKDIPNFIKTFDFDGLGQREQVALEKRLARGVCDLRRAVDHTPVSSEATYVNYIASLSAFIERFEYDPTQGDLVPYQGGRAV